MNTLFEKQEQERREPSALTRGLVEGTNRTDDYIGSAAIAVKETPKLFEKCKKVIEDRTREPTQEEKTIVDSAQIVKEIVMELGR